MFVPAGAPVGNPEFRFPAPPIVVSDDFYTD